METMTSRAGDEARRGVYKLSFRPFDSSFLSSTNNSHLHLQTNKPNHKKSINPNKSKMESIKVNSSHLSPSSSFPFPHILNHIFIPKPAKLTPHRTPQTTSPSPSRAPAPPPPRKPTRTSPRTAMPASAPAPPPPRTPSSTRRTRSPTTSRARPTRVCFDLPSPFSHSLGSRPCVDAQQRVCNE